MRGDYEQIIACFHKTKDDVASRLRACSITIAAAISTGNYPLYMEIENFLKDIEKLYGNSAVSAFAQLGLASAYTDAFVPDMAVDWLKKGDFSALHPLLRQDASYKRAKYFHASGQFEAMLITAQSALGFCEPAEGFTSLYVIYFRVVCAIACHTLGRTKGAKNYLLDALNIALPHGFITPFAESATTFGSLL